MSQWTLPEYVRRKLKAGRDILYIGFSSALSAAYQTGHAVLEELKKDYPDSRSIPSIRSAPRWAKACW